MFLGVPKKINTTVTAYCKIFEKKRLKNYNNIAISRVKGENLITQLEERQNTTLKFIDQADKDLQFEDLPLTSEELKYS